MNILDNNISNDERIAVGQNIEKIEDTISDLQSQNYDFNYEAEFIRDAKMEAEL